MKDDIDKKKKEKKGKKWKNNIEGCRRALKCSKSIFHDP